MQGTTTRRRRGYSAGTCPKPFNSAPMAVNSASFGAPHVRPTGFTWGAPNGIAKITHPKTFIRSCSAQVCALGAARREQGAQVRVPGRLISPPWRSIRFRLAPRTYAPWHVRPMGRTCRSQTKSRKKPTRNILPLFFASSYFVVSDCFPPNGGTSGQEQRARSMFPVGKVLDSGRLTTRAEGPHGGASYVRGA